jgi:hypothetical protein
MPLPQQPGTPASHGGPLPPGGPPSPNAPHVSAFATSSTPSTSSAGLPRAKSSASAFVPAGTPRKGLVIRDESGRPIDLSAVAKQPNAAPPVSPIAQTPSRHAHRVSVRLESEADKLAREKRETEEKEAKEKVEREKAEKVATKKKAKKEAGRKAKERKVKEEADRKGK